MTILELPYIACVQIYVGIVGQRLKAPSPRPHRRPLGSDFALFYPLWLQVSWSM
jgi:hypothetical protein